MEEQYKRNPNLTDSEQEFWDRLSLPENTRRVKTEHSDLLMTTQKVTVKKRQLKGDWTIQVSGTKAIYSEDIGETLLKIIEDEFGNVD